MSKTPGLNLPYGIDPVNALPVDSNYGPYSTLASAKSSIPLALRYDGMTVMITGDGEYWWNQADLTDSGLKKKGGSGGGFPKVQYVYLVSNAADATTMGGAAGNTYTTFQAAYDAANALQLSIGGFAQVVIKVGTTASGPVIFGNFNTVGDLNLTADWNGNVMLVGISPTSSLVGDIYATNASGNAYNVDGGSFGVCFSNVRTGSIMTNATGTTGNSGNIKIIAANCACGSLDTSITNASNTTGNGGNVQIFSGQQISNGFYSDGIYTRARSTSATAGGLQLDGQNMQINDVQLASNNLGGLFQMNGINCYINAFSTITSYTSLSGTQTVVGFRFDVFTMSNPGATFGGDPYFKFYNCDFGTFNLTHNGLNASRIPVSYSKCTFSNLAGHILTQNFFVGCTFFQRQIGSNPALITNLGTNSMIVNCGFVMLNTSSPNPIINGVGTGCQIVNSSLVGGSFCVNNSTAVNVIGQFIYYSAAPHSNVTFI